MTREEAIKVLGDVSAYLASRASLENESLAGHTFTDICRAIKVLRQEPCEDAVPMSVIEEIKAEIKTKYESIPSVPWRFSEYDDGWVMALEYTLEVIDKHIGKEHKE